jgi:hypothetical protein
MDTLSSEVRELLAERDALAKDVARLREATEILRDCWNQFAYEGGKQLDGKWDGGLSTLESVLAFLQADAALSTTTEGENDA